MLLNLRNLEKLEFDTESLLVAAPMVISAATGLSTQEPQL